MGRTPPLRHCPRRWLLRGLPTSTSGPGPPPDLRLRNCNLVAVCRACHARLHGIRSDASTLATLAARGYRAAPAPGVTALGCFGILVRLIVLVVLVLLSGLALLELAAGRSFAAADLQFTVILWLIFFAVPALWRRIFGRRS
jgi:hypothetical protein